VRSIVVVTSDKVYRNDGRGRSFRESDPLGGGDPYSASKAMAEMIVECWRDSIDKATKDVPPLATARAGNVIGGGDRAAGRIVPDLIEALEDGRPVQLRNPHAVRPWQHVLEPVVGYLMYAGALGQRSVSERPIPDSLNFGPPSEAEITVERLVELALRKWGSGTWIAAEAGSAGPEASSLTLCSDEARAALGWAPVFSLGRALDLTINWYRAALDSPGSCPEVSTAQVRTYLESTKGELPW
jgi:CDP-glucose 4,6-dehydratase